MTAPAGVPPMNGAAPSTIPIPRPIDAAWRTDRRTFGGAGDNGAGREGLKYDIRDMTEQRLILFNV